MSLWCSQCQYCQCSVFSAINQSAVIAPINHCFACLQLLDVGTCPQPGSIWKLIHAMEENHQIGGVCGEIAAREPKFFNFVESSQHFEYKISHVLDKGATGIDTGKRVLAELRNSSSRVNFTMLCFQPDICFFATMVFAIKHYKHFPY
jgi:hypothetical protein